MADKLRIVGTGQGSRRRLVNDLPFRNDLLSNRQQEYVTAMVKHVNPYSPFLFFTGLFGTTENELDQRDPNAMFRTETSTTGAEFIRIREEIYEKRPFYVVDSSRVPTRLVAGEPFEVGLDYAILDEGEMVKLWDDKTILTVVSRRYTAKRVVDVTFILNGQPGDTADGSLLSVGKPINWGFGNTKGEGSETSNTLPMNSNKHNLFYNPTVISRYMWSETGSAMTDEVFKFSTVKAMDGSEPLNFAVNIPVEAFKLAIKSIEGMIMDSVANFDPQTLLPSNMGGLNGYPELPSYAGVFQQMDQAHVQYKFPLKSSYLASLNRIESIQRQIQEIWTGADIMIIARGGGAKWAHDALLIGGQEKYKVQLNRTVPEDGMVDIGFGIRRFKNQDGAIYVYDISKGYKTNGEYQTWQHKGYKGSNRSREIYFVPVQRGSDGTTKKLVRYFTKRGNGIDRGFVFGRVKGLTGQGNGKSGAELMSMQENAIRDMMSNELANLGSVADRNEYHMLFEGVPYIDIYGIIKVTLVS